MSREQRKTLWIQNQGGSSHTECQPHPGHIRANHFKPLPQSTLELSSSGASHTIQAMSGLSLPALRFFADHSSAFRDLCSERNGLLQRDSDGTRGWSNVVHHTLMAGAATEALCTLLGVSRESTQRLTGFMLVHDSEKRRQYDKDFSATLGTSASVRSPYLDTVDPDLDLQKATGTEYVDEVIYPRASLEQQIVHYIDTLCLGGSVTSVEARIADVRARRQDLGDEYWNRETSIALSEADHFSVLLAERGIDCSPAKIPSLIISTLLGNSRERQDQTPLKNSKLEYTESFGPHLHTEWSRYTPRALASLNEDCIAVKIGDSRIRGAVIDGASSISGSSTQTGSGRLAASLAAETIFALPLKVDPVECMKAANDRLAEALHESGLDPSMGAEHFSSSAFIFSLDRDHATRSFILRFAALGDCCLALKTASEGWTWIQFGAGEYFERLEIESAQREARARNISLREVLPLLGEFPETSRIIAGNRLRENSPDGSGTGALKGSRWEDVSQYLTSGELILDENDFLELVCMSDGALLPMTESDAVRQAAFTDSLERNGTTGVITARLMAGDANVTCENPPCLKSVDDIGIVRVRARKL